MAVLNKQQSLASRPLPGISLVIAGAGTGKTKVLVEKARNIINAGMAKPQEILILTFSNKAAREIKDRVEQEVGKCGEDIISGTFHSFCLDLLKINSEALTSFFGFKYFPKVLDQDARENLLKDLLRNSIDRFSGLPADVVEDLLENAERLDKRTYDKLKRIGIIRELDEFGRRFKEYKILNHLIDFKDMMDYSINLLTYNNSVKDQVVNKYKYVLVDEFQDTSEDNFNLLKLILPADKPNLFLVGDDWQSIYGFRGSNIDYIVKMKRYFPEAVIYKLKLNYRSKKEIVDLSNNFIRKNRKRTYKKLKSAKGRGGNIKGFPVNNIDEELGVITDIFKEIKNKKNSLDNIAVLYRNNWQGRYIVDRLKPFIEGLNSIKFLTIHAAKGLEFDSVIIAGVSDDIIPGSSSDIEEERRLFYVALTRAMENLYIVHHRSPNGGLSVFAEEMGLSNS